MTNLNTNLEKEFIYKDRYKFVLQESYVYRNYTILDKCVVQVIRRYNSNDYVWYAMNIGNSVPCFKGFGATIEESLDKLFIDMREHFKKEQEQARKMIDLTNDILGQ